MGITHNRSGILRTSAAIAAGVAAMLVLSGCAAVDETGSNGGAPEGDVVKIGFINQNAGSIATYPEVDAAYRAAIAHINEDLGGLAGKDIELDACTTDGTPTSSQNCAQQMVQNRPSLVLIGNDYNTGVIYPLLQEFQTFGQVPTTAADFTSPNLHFFNSGSAGSSPAIPAYFKEHPTDNKTFGVMDMDIAITKIAASMVADPLEAMGFDVRRSSVTATTTDYSAAMLSLNPQSIGGLTGTFPANGCIAMGKAYEQQQLDIPVFANQSCYAPEVLTAVGDTMVGWYISQLTADPASDEPDAVEYREVMTKNAPDTEPTAGQAPMAYSAIMTLYNNVLKPMSDEGIELTTASIGDYLAGPAKTGTVTLGGDYECGLVDAVPTICNWNVFFYEVGEAPDYGLQTIPHQEDPINTASILNEYYQDGLPTG